MPRSRLTLARGGQHTVRHKRIILALGGEVAHRAVAGDEHGFAAQGPEFLGDGVNEVGVVAPRKVCPADGALEQHIADNRQLGGGVMKDNMARRMARTMDDIEYERADGHLVAVRQPAIGREGVGAGDAVSSAFGGGLVDPELVVWVRAFDGHTQIGGEHAGHAAMIDMAMGDEQFFDGDALFGGHGFEALKVAAGVCERAAHGFGAPDQRAILLQRGHGQDDGLEGRRCGLKASHGRTLTPRPFFFQPISLKA